MSISITVQNAVKRYGSVSVIRDLSMKVEKGQFFTLLGPSGCGKTTLLRMIAGFNTIEGGDFYFNEVRINDMEPGKRNVGMVFQNYAVFPHMTVRQNVAFGLKNRRTPREQTEKLTNDFLRLVQMEEYADRRPANLSGGQQQRIALARALVIHPDVLLMDEPLSNLDAKLRVEMRAVIRDLQRKVGITTIYVTHDQEEAMAISDIIAVMDKGRIMHTGAPKDIYQRPSNLFVATFIGKSNLLAGHLEKDQNGHRVVLSSGYGFRLDGVSKDARHEQEIVLVARPEEIQMRRPDDVGEGLPGVVLDSVFLGLNTHYFVQLEDGETLEVVEESQHDAILEAGTRVLLRFNVRKVNIFDRKNENSLMADVRNIVFEGA